MRKSINSLPYTPENSQVLQRAHDFSLAALLIWHEAIWLMILIERCGQGLVYPWDGLYWFCLINMPTRASASFWDGKSKIHVQTTELKPKEKFFFIGQLLNLAGFVFIKRLKFPMFLTYSFFSYSFSMDAFWDEDCCSQIITYCFIKYKELQICLA